MSRRRLRFPALLALAIAAAWAPGCSSPVGPDPESVNIRLDVGGGFAGVAWTIEVDGEAGVVRGVSCEQGCDFDTGSVILALSDYQIRTLAVALEDAGIFGYDGQDFGTQCCDQFEYRLVYERNLREADVAGSSGALPDPLAGVVARLHALGEGRIPVIVDFMVSPPVGWPDDGLAIDGISLDGSELVVHVDYGGGCENHSIDLLAWNGFMESNPVQVDALLAHDARSDPCDALVSSTRHFDLRPLADAWRDAYRLASGTIILHVFPPGSAGSVTVTYHF